MSDKCDTKVTKPNIGAHLRTAESQQRFLVAYAELRQIRAAAARVGIHRATIYRWRADPAFVDAMGKAWRAGHARWLKEVYEPRQAVDRAARAERQAELRPMRRELAYNAREAKRQAGR